MKGMWKKRKHSEASVCCQQVINELGHYCHLFSLPPELSLVCLPQASLKTLCCTWVPIHDSLALQSRLIQNISQRFGIPSPDLYLRIKGGNLSLMSHGHWEAGNISLAGGVGKNSPSGFQVYLTNSFTTCQMKLLLFRWQNKLFPLPFLHWAV